MVNELHDLKMLEEILDKVQGAFLKTPTPKDQRYAISQLQAMVAEKRKIIADFEKEFDGSGQSWFECGWENPISVFDK